MDNRIARMLENRPAGDAQSQKHTLREVAQEIALCGLSRAGFFDKAAFYGGTALRIFYGLDRFSEDLDFSLVESDVDFSLERYLASIQNEAASYGMSFEVAAKQKARSSAIQSAFLKAGTRQHLLLFYEEGADVAAIPESELVKIKLEVDVDPAESATFNRKYRLMPIPYEVRLYDEPSLFAGKIHAVLCRAWRTRVKGRDLYDYVFYRARGTEVNLAHLNAKLVQTGFLRPGERLDTESLQESLERRFRSIDFEQAKQDVLPFLERPEVLDLWSADFFESITMGLQARG